MELKMIDTHYMDSRAEIEYNAHDEMQIKIILNKLKLELKRRYGERTYLIKDEQLRKFVEG